MAKEIQVPYTTGRTVYAQILNAVGQIWNGSAFETYATANIATYAITMTESGTASQLYMGNFPALAVGVYSVIARYKSTGSFLEADIVVGSDNVYWSGTVLQYLGIPQTGDSFTRIGALGAGLTALAPSATALSTAVWTGTIAGRIDASISSRLADASYTAPNNIGISAIQFRTDQLQFGLYGLICDVASIGGVESSAQNVSIFWASGSSYLDNFETFWENNGDPAVNSTLDSLAPASATTSILNMLGSWAGSGVNTILGAFRAIWNKEPAITPSDLTDNITSGNEGDNTTDSLPALQEQLASSGLDAAGIRAAIGMAAADLDDQLDTIYAAAIAVTTATVNLVSPVSTRGNKVYHTRGDDYYAVDRTVATWNVSSWPDFTGGTAVFNIDVNGTILSFPVDVIPPRTLRLQMSADDTLSVDVGIWPFDLKVELDVSDHVFTAQRSGKYFSEESIIAVP